MSPLKDNLSPWEEWFIGKEKELRARLQARVAEVITSSYFDSKSSKHRIFFSLVVETQVVVFSFFFF